MLDQLTPLLAAGSPFGGMLPFILMIGVFYFLVMRPMKKQEDERKQRLAEIKRGDKVVLTGGMLGRVSRIDGEIAVVEVADKVKVRVLKKDITDFEENVLAKAKDDAEQESKGLLAGLLGGGGSSKKKDDESDSEDSRKAG